MARWCFNHWVSASSNTFFRVVPRLSASRLAASKSSSEISIVVFMDMALEFSCLKTLCYRGYSIFQPLMLPASMRPGEKLNSKPIR